MKIDQALVTNLANTAVASSGVTGGATPSVMQAKEYKKGVEIIVKTASLTDESYRLEVKDNQLVLYTSYGVGGFDKDGNAQKPTTIRVFPIANQVNKEEIDALFEEGALHIFLPFQEGKEDTRQEIPIRTKYNL